MAEILLIAAIVFAVVAVGLLLLCYVSGLFHKIEVETGKPPIGKAVIAYKFARGPYKKAWDMCTELARHVPKGYKYLGIYYDDPKQVAQENLRCVIGAILSENDSPIDDKVKKAVTEAGCRLFTLPQVPSVVRTWYPEKNFLSVLFAIYRVYPKMADYVLKKKLRPHPYLEVYFDSKIHFMAPLSRQDEFYVDETKEEKEKEK